MFDKLITMNYRRGHGGEFFCYMLDSALTNREFDQDARFGTFNRYEYVGVDFIFKTFMHHFIWCTFSNYDSIEEYVDKEFGYPNRYNVSLRKNLSIKKMDNLILAYNLYIKEDNREDQILNIKEYCNDVCKREYNNYFDFYDDEFAISNLHYNNTNRFNLPVSYFFENSKNICLVNNEIDEYFYTLLWIYKRLPDLKYYPAAYKSAFRMPKEELIEYFKFDKRKTYGSFPGELEIETFDLHYRGLNIDNKLSELLGIKVNLDYPRILSYAAKNRQMMIEYFDVDVFKDYSEEQIYSKFSDYVNKVYDDI